MSVTIRGNECRGDCDPPQEDLITRIVETVRLAGYVWLKPSARYPGMRRCSEAARIGVARSW